MWILYILGGLLALAVIYGIFVALCRSFPWLRWVLALAIAVGTFALWGIWWVSLLILLIAIGFFHSITESKTKRGNAIHCMECDFDMVDILQEDDHTLTYKCPKCGHRGVYVLRR